MSIRYTVLGKPGEDNALLVSLNSGEKETTILFDCGEDTVSTLSISQRQSIALVCFSHFHIDHIAGFDSWFRTVYDRTDAPNILAGPPGSTDILGNRLRGFEWNLQTESPVQWQIIEIHKDRMHSSSFALRNSFSPHDVKQQELSGLPVPDENFSVEPVFLNHSTVSLGYIIKEKAKRNINTENLRALGLQPGPWLQVVKDLHNPQKQLTINGKAYNLENLRKSLLSETPGESLAYLTDFSPEKTHPELLEKLKGCTTIICEAQYSLDDEALALKNYHLTTIQAAMLAYRAGAGKLVLHHISARYPLERYPALLAEARSIFRNTSFPSAWNIPE